MTLAQELSTVGAICSATVMAVQVVKRALGDVPWARRVPTWCYSVLVAAGLTLFARFGLHSIDGDPAEIVWQAVKQAAMASGFYTWYAKHDDPLHQSGSGRPPPAAADDDADRPTDATDGVGRIVIGHDDRIELR